ncbi:MAG: M15 family metallopeptidase [Lachnospiraceae bacterium]|nr:M15 family metallopeptidase [Lachnospiraceae bacterium]
MLVLSVFLLFIDRLVLKFRSGFRKFSIVILSLTFAFVSCSFSSVIWGDGAADFTYDTSAFYYETEESAAALAVEQEIDASLLPEEYDEEDEEALTVSEKGQVISEEDMISAEDLVGNMDQSMIQETEEEAATGSEHTFSRDEWQLTLVNKNHPISEDYTFTLGTIKGSMQCDERIIPDLYAMIEAAYNDGINLIICSPYRNDSRQQMLFDRKVNKYMAQGMSYMDAYKVAAQVVTIPGSSEHQIGLAIDFITDNHSSLDEAFGQTPAGIWIAEHSYEYGFIIRYPEGKEDITGIEFEPWHLRYVGKKAAKVIYEESITLEEFWEKYL